ncbi:MAG TPA: hypothetical protein VIV61_17640 [Candidatus Ozemobacteraceae bacterium]
MNCPYCGSPVPSSDVNIVRLIAKCKSCNEVFSFGEGGAPVSGHPAAKRGAEPPPMPANLQAAVIGDTLHIRYKWFRPSILFLMFFAIAWDSFLVFWYSAAIFVSGPEKFIMLLFPIAHLAVGVAITYAVLCGLFNTTTVSVSRGALGIRHAPFSWGFGNILVPVGELDQLYCRSEKSHSKNGTTTTYSLHAILTNGKHLDLIKNLEDRDLASYLEYAIEGHLGIEDRPVSGEMQKHS